MQSIKDLCLARSFYYAIGLLLWTATPALAQITLVQFALSHDGTDITVFDNSANDDDPADGRIELNGDLLGTGVFVASNLACELDIPSSSAGVKITGEVENIFGGGNPTFLASCAFGIDSDIDVESSSCEIDAQFANLGGTIPSILFQLVEAIPFVGYCNAQALSCSGGPSDPCLLTSQASVPASVSIEGGSLVYATMIAGFTTDLVGSGSGPVLTIPDNTLRAGFTIATPVVPALSALLSLSLSGALLVSGARTLYRRR